MSTATPESKEVCGVVEVTDDATASPKEDLPPIDPKNPGPGIDARLKRAFDALRRIHPSIPEGGEPSSDC